VNHGERTLQWRSRCAEISWPAKLAGVSCCPGSFPGPAGAEKEAYNPDRAAASIPAHPSPYPEVQPGCTGCRVHPGCTKAIAAIIKQDVEYSRGAEARRRAGGRAESAAKQGMRNDSTLTAGQHKAMKAIFERRIGEGMDAANAAAAALREVAAAAEEHEVWTAGEGVRCTLWSTRGWRARARSG
jgi:hypothetical protein